MSFYIRDFVTGVATAIRSTIVQITTDSVEYVPHHVSEVAPVENRVIGVGSTTGTSSTAVTGVGAVAAMRNNVCAVQMANSGSTGVTVQLQDGSGGAELATIYCPANSTIAVIYPSPLRLSVDTGLYFQADAGTTTLTVSAQGYLES